MTAEQLHSPMNPSQPQDEQNLIGALAQNRNDITDQLVSKMTERMMAISNYTPRIGVLGKTGVGKSSLCNALFGAELCPVSDIEACTREPQDVLLQMGTGKKLVLVDVPGVGESMERDAEYAALYQQLLPELDLVIWVLKADDRAYSVDIEFYEQMVRPYMEAGIPFFVVLNQVDKIAPFREWNLDLRRPGPTQADNIDRKIADVSGHFALPGSRVVPVSVEERYGLVRLVDEMIFALPAEKRAPVGDVLSPEIISDNTRQVVRSSIWETIKEEARKIITHPLVLPGLIEAGVKLAKRFFGRWL